MNGRWIVVWWLVLTAFAAGQDAPSLGDVAKADRARQAHTEAGRTWDEENTPHGRGLKITNEYWATIPASTLTLTLPSNTPPARSNTREFPLPSGNHSASVLFGETSWGEDFQNAANDYVTLLLTRTDFRGSKFKLGSVEDTNFDGHRALLIRFQLLHKTIPHAGMALFIQVPEQVLSAGCIYLKADEEQAGPMCEDIINSAAITVPAGEYTRVSKPRH